MMQCSRPRSVQYRAAVAPLTENDHCERSPGVSPSRAAAIVSPANVIVWHNGSARAEAAGADFRTTFHAQLQRGRRCEVTLAAPSAPGPENGNPGRRMRERPRACRCARTQTGGSGGNTLFRMVRTIPMLNKCRPKTGDDQAAPLAVFYVVETSGQVMGERHHRVCSHLFETTLQAHAELARLELANASGAFSIWKGTTYIEPAEWLYDVIMADGTVIPARRGSYCPVCIPSPSPPPL